MHVSRLSFSSSSGTALVAALLAAAGTVIACSNRADGGNQANAEAALMQQGLTQMNDSSDPIAAEATFRELLRRNPTHYGGTYQLAVALDRGGRPVEARAQWQEVLRLARGAGDSSVIATAQGRLAAPDTASPSAMMALGLDLLYKQGNPAAAAEQFRKVLARNPVHYGAAYQLATALDRSGQRAEATPVWVKVLGMATQYQDQKTIQIARERLR